MQMSYHVRVASIQCPVADHQLLGHDVVRTQHSGLCAGTTHTRSASAQVAQKAKDLQQYLGSLQREQCFYAMMQLMKRFMSQCEVQVGL